MSIPFSNNSDLTGAFPKTKKYFYNVILRVKPENNLGRQKTSLPFQFAPDSENQKLCNYCLLQFYKFATCRHMLPMSYLKKDSAQKYKDIVLTFISLCFAREETKKRVFVAMFKKRRASVEGKYGVMLNCHTNETWLPDKDSRHQSF